MRALRLLAVVMAVLLAGGEIARRAMAGSGAIQALDEVLVAVALLWAATRPSGARMAAAWGAFGSLSLVLFTTTLGEVLRPAGKSGGGIYVLLLGTMVALSLWAIRRALRRG